MQAAILPFSSGWTWIIQAYRLFLRQPLALFSWGMVTTLLIMASYLIFPIGPLLLIAATPTLTLITLSACRQIDAGKTMTPAMWLAPLQTPRVRARLIKLGLSYLACCLAGGLLAVLPFASQIAEQLAALSANGAADPETLSHLVLGPLFVFLLCYVLISALFWHAPALIGWHDLTLARALFFSMVACWRNKWPFLLYGASWGAIFFAVQTASTWMLDAGVSPVTAQWLITPLNILVMTLLYCSFYPTYVSVFGARAGTHPTPSAGVA